MTSMGYSFFHLQNKNAERLFSLINEALPHLNHTFKTALNIFIRYKNYITNAIELPYSNAKLEATNELIKDIKQNAFGYRNFDNFKKHTSLALNITKEKTTFVFSYKSPTTVDNETKKVLLTTLTN